MPQFNAKILSSTDVVTNDANRAWWERNPMTYDWDSNIANPELSADYFSRIDEIFGEGHSLVNNPAWPEGSILENFLPYQQFAGRKVLEIGCGAGLVSSHIARSGGKLHAVDITARAVEITRRRFELMKLSGDIVQMDAERLSFEDGSFDYVVSWGVIHHSGNMPAILDEIHRVLRPGGRAFIMVYNRGSLRYQVYCRFWLGILGLRLLRESLEDIVGSITDGHVARHLTTLEFDALARRFSSVEYSFSDEKTTILKYLFGIGRPFRPLFPLTKGFERWLARRWGWYLEAKLTK